MLVDEGRGVAGCGARRPWLPCAPAESPGERHAQAGALAGAQAARVAGLPCVLAERGLGAVVLGFLEVEDLCALRRASHSCNETVRQHSVRFDALLPPLSLKQLRRRLLQQTPAQAARRMGRRLRAQTEAGEGAVEPEGAVAEACVGVSVGVGASAPNHLYSTASVAASGADDALVGLGVLSLAEEERPSRAYLRSTSHGSSSSSSTGTSAGSSEERRPGGGGSSGQRKALWNVTGLRVADTTVHGLLASCVVRAPAQLVFLQLSCLGLPPSPDGASPLGRLSALGGLRALELDDVAGVRGLAELASLGGLRSLALRCLRDLETLAGTEQLAALAALQVRDCCALRSVAALQHSAALERLELDGLDALKELGAALPPGLRKLRVQRCALLGDEELRALPAALEHLELRLLPRLTEVPRGLGALARLRVLAVAGCTRLAALHELEPMPALRALDLSCCAGLALPALRDIARNLPGLRELDLGLCSRLTSVEALTQCGHLEWLSLWRCARVNDAATLASVRSLRFLDITGLRAQDIDDLESRDGVDGFVLEETDSHLVCRRALLPSLA
jgi:hypothetical protein